MPLDRNAVGRGVGEHIRDLQQRRYVSPAEKRQIELQHQRIAEKVQRDRERRGK